MSIETIIEDYSKRWKVSPEEAERMIREMLDNPNKKETAKGSAKEKTPSPENLFPEPIGEISKKIQDVNQATLSTAYTQRLLSAPPEDVAALRAKIESLDRIVGDLKAGLEDQIQRLTETLEDKKRQETREELLKELDTRMNPLRENLKKLTEKLEGVEKGEGEEKEGAGGVMKPSEVLKEADKIAEEAKGWLGKLGYKVEPEKLSKEEVQKMIDAAQKEALANLPPEELKKRLEDAGYKIVGGPLTYEQVQKLVEEAKRRAQEDALEDKRIEAVQNIIRDSVGKIIGMFQPAVEIWMRSSLESRAGQTPPKSKRE